MSERKLASIPDPSSRMACRMFSAPHFALLDVDQLSQQCRLRTQRRSGPGGQHRNKTSSGVFLEHQPTGLVGEATERRSQAHNRDVALQRLRYLLAVIIRTPSPIDEESPTDALESKLRRQFRGHSLKLNEQNLAKPAVLSLILNDLWASGGQPSLMTPLWSVSTSRIVMLLRSHPAALTWVNAVRSHHGRLPLH